MCIYSTADLGRDWKSKARQHIEVITEGKPDDLAEWDVHRDRSVPVKRWWERVKLWRILYVVLATSETRGRVVHFHS